MSPILTPACANSLQPNTLRLLLQTPDVLFAYWQLSAVKERMIEVHFDKPWRELAPALRFCMETAEEASWLELPLPDGEACFLTGFHAGAFVSADLGIYNTEGQFLPLLRSNRLQLPGTGSVKAAAQHAQDGRLTVLYTPQPLSLAQGKPLASEFFSAYSVYYPTSPQQI
ncbi:DUF4912 domain-containing protein [Paenibacillus oryzisoli]|uniref:DUF4912 domain-containing protein n=1 Tax=Paenibacillus oryzisoli TaxID=1850517 RepID=UPI003D294D9B